MSLFVQIDEQKTAIRGRQSCLPSLQRSYAATSAFTGGIKNGLRKLAAPFPVTEVAQATWCILLEWKKGKAAQKTGPRKTRHASLTAN